MSVYVTSVLNTPEVIKMILEKYQVESESNQFALYVVKDSGGITITYFDLITVF